MSFESEADAMSQSQTPQHDTVLKSTMPGEHSTQLPRSTIMSSVKQQTKEVWTQKLQYVVLIGDKLKFYSVEPIDDPYFTKDVILPKLTIVYRFQIINLSFTERMV